MAVDLVDFKSRKATEFLLPLHVSVISADVAVKAEKPFGQVVVSLSCPGGVEGKQRFIHKLAKCWRFTLRSGFFVLALHVDGNQTRIYRLTRLFLAEEYRKMLPTLVYHTQSPPGYCNCIQCCYGLGIGPGETAE